MAVGAGECRSLPLVIEVGKRRIRGLRWRDAGLRLPEGWPRLAAIGVVVGIAMWLLEFFFTMPLLHRVLGYWPDLTDFNDLVGNATLLAIYLALNWMLAAFGEEMVWRGYALPRVAAFAGTGMRAWIVALVVVNVAFGLAHLYQGPSGNRDVPRALPRRRVTRDAHATCILPPSRWIS